MYKYKTRKKLEIILGIVSDDNLVPDIR